MKALVFDTTLGSWDKTRGFELRDVPAQVWDERKDPTDANKVLLKVHYAGICGTDVDKPHDLAKSVTAK